MKTTAIISTQRSYSDLIWRIKKILPKFLGFEGIGILFRDTKTDHLFSISDTFDESELKLMKERDEKQKRGAELSEE